MCFQLTLYASCLLALLCYVPATSIGQVSAINSCDNVNIANQRGTCRLGGCRDNEYRIPGYGLCDLYSSYWVVFYCVDRLACCSRGGSCKSRCSPGDSVIDALTDCATSGTQCCVTGGDSGRKEKVARHQGVCGRINTLGPRIIGGTVAQPRDWPWMARLVYNNPKHGFCAGVLVDDDTVLTVAHCVAGISQEDIKVLLGDFDITQTERDEELVDVRSVETNPKFVLGERGNDLAVIKLSRPVTFTNRKSPACLPDPDIPIRISSSNRVPVSDNGGCYIAGWGRTENGKVSPKLRTAPVSLMDMVTCNAVLRAVSGYFASSLPSDVFCADSSATNTDACLFDDGGMLVCLDAKNRYSLVGLISEYSCGHLPTIFTRISNYTVPILARL